jgi:hypothetical protein
MTFGDRVATPVKGRHAGSKNRRSGEIRGQIKP